MGMPGPCEHGMEQNHGYVAKSERLVVVSGDWWKRGIALRRNPVINLRLVTKHDVAGSEAGVSALS